MIVDGAMNDLIRPSLYQAYQHIEPVGPAARARQQASTWWGRSASRPTSWRRTARCRASSAAICSPCTRPAPTASPCPPTTTAAARAAEVLVRGDRFAVVREREGLRGPGARRVDSRGSHPMTPLPFTKMHGAGNDFVVLDALARGAPAASSRWPRGSATATSASAPTSSWSCAPRGRRTSAWRSSTPTAPRWRCAPTASAAFYKYLRDRGHTDADEIGVETLSGVVRPRWAGEDGVTVDMGRPVLEPGEDPHDPRPRRGPGARRAPRGRRRDARGLLGLDGQPPRGDHRRRTRTRRRSSGSGR